MMPLRDFSILFWAVYYLLLHPLHAKAAFIEPHYRRTWSVVRRISSCSSTTTALQQQTKQESWSVTDDWNSMSSAENREYSSSNDNDNDGAADLLWMTGADPATRAVWRILAHQLATSKATVNQDTNSNEEEEEEEEEKWLDSVIDMIQSDTQPPQLKSQEPEQTDSLNVERFMDDMGDEIAMLVRCNQSPESMLIEQGRALPVLSDAERFDPQQVVDFSDTSNCWSATPFFQKAILTMFNQHKNSNNNDDDGGGVMDAESVAKWMTCSLGETVGPYDRRVTTTISRFADYGTGILTLGNFQSLYLEAVVGPSSRQPRQDSHQLPAITPNRLFQLRESDIRNVWRDLKNHGILPPAEVEHEALRKEFELHHDVAVNGEMIMDECEIVEQIDGVSLTTDREGKSSHALVELAPDGETPLWMRDDAFVFIDEESCIGCTQCISAAPSTFRMLENGRARTFHQRDGQDVVAAVAACPVDCMHFVSFRELKEFETARDEGDGREDHRHFGSSKDRGYIGRTPLHVNGIESDSNHRSSWYHYLKNKCFMSSQCPQRGCYDCPMYKSAPGTNPYFQKRLRQSAHVRAQYFMEKGTIDHLRKTADL